MKFLFMAFVVIPVVEMSLLIKVGSIIGALNTIGFVLLTAFIGAAMLRKQGLNTLIRANSKLNSGEIPAQEVAEGFLLAVGGALLLTPGFVTDGFGFLLLLPLTRKALVQKVIDRLTVLTPQPGSTQFHANYTRYRSGDDSTIIEGEFYQTSEHPRFDHELPGNSDQNDKKN